MPEQAVQQDLGADRDLGLYRLTLHNSQRGRFYVKRARWHVWGGELVAMNARRVSGYLATRDATREFAKSYSSTHAGCASATEVLAACAAGAPRVTR